MFKRGKTMKTEEKCLSAHNCCGPCSTCKPIGEVTKKDGKLIRTHGTEYIGIN